MVAGALVGLKLLYVRCAKTAEVSSVIKLANTYLESTKSLMSNTRTKVSLSTEASVNDNS